MTLEACPKCHKPQFPHASESLKALGSVCLCAEGTRPQSSRSPIGNQAIENQAIENRKSPIPDLEQLYLDILAEHAPDLPAPLRQQELIPGRKFTTDFCWPHARLAVEIEGACHRTKERFYSDCDKQNLLVAEGWAVLRFNGRMLRGQVLQVVEWTRAGLGKLGKRVRRP